MTEDDYAAQAALMAQPCLYCAAHEQASLQLARAVADLSRRCQQAEAERDALMRAVLASPPPEPRLQALARSREADAEPRSDPSDPPEPRARGQR